MAARVKALIKGPVLRWARETAGYSVPEAAQKLEIDQALYESWEADQAAPSVPQLRKVAGLFARPLAVFYLATPPKGFEVLRDLRRLPSIGFRRLPADVQKEIRAASQQRELALELAAELDLPITQLSMAATRAEPAGAVAARIRELLGVDAQTQFSWRDSAGRIPFNSWRSRIEAAGVLVFQATRFSTEEASGFAIWHERLPLMVVNRADPPTRRTFSLIHEFVHLVIRESGVSDQETDASRPAEDQAIEVFCNEVAASVLMPQTIFLAYDAVAARSGASDHWSDAEIADIATAFGVSREAVVRRLLTVEKTTNSFYRAKRAQYAAERAAAKSAQRDEPSEVRRNMPQEIASNLGRPLVRLVLNNYYSDRMTLSEVLGYLGLKAKHIPKLEQVVGLR